ncbi:MAG: glycosyltransferase family 4 protein [Desulfuromonadales bacterium]|nr:glycosyltransferase family 4 protein [Desulfuromonadales bacterium]
MRILHLLSQRPELTGSGVYLNQMIQQAQARGHENAMLAGVPDDFHHQPGTIDCRTFFLRFGRDIPHHVTGMSDVMPYPSTRFRDLSDEQLDHYEQSFAELLHLAIQDFQPEIIHSNHLWIVSALARRLFPDIPIIASCHGSDLRQFRSNPHLQQRILKDCRELDGVLALSQAQRDEIIELYGIAPRKVHVTGVGFNSRTFTWAPKKSGGPIRLAYAGKLSNAKGVPWLLRALGKLTDIDLVLDLCGSAAGPEKDDIVAQAQRMGNRVILHGNVEPQRLAEIMRQAHIFVLPSFFEGLPLVLLEAMACGCRPVATRLPGVEEVFSHLEGNGISLVELPELQGIDSPLPEAEEGFVERLAAAIREQTDASRDNPRTSPCPEAEKLLARYSWNAIFDGVEEIYRKLHPG